VEWQTLLELDLLGFNLYRSNTLLGEKVRLNMALIPADALGGLGGASYAFVDADIQPGERYYYWLEFVEISGERLHPTPVTIDVPYVLFLPLVGH
jgi:hypothetical protein